MKIFGLPTSSALSSTEKSESTRDDKGSDNSKTPVMARKYEKIHEDHKDDLESGCVMDTGSQEKEHETQDTERSTNQCAPDQQLTQLAVVLGILENISSYLRYVTIAFGIAVPLGAMIIAERPYDMWVAMAILIIEQFRVICRTEELKLKCGPVSVRHHEAEDDAAIWMMLQGGYCKVLFWGQICLAGACTGLSLTRLIGQRFDHSENPVQNLASVALLFYSLALAEASFFLIEKAIWVFYINYKKLPVNVLSKCGLDKLNIMMVETFFCSVYAKCLKDGYSTALSMNLVEYSLQKLCSDNASEQEGSMKMLAALIEHKEFAHHSIIINGPTCENAISPLPKVFKPGQEADKQIRLAAAKIIACFAYHHSDLFQIDILLQMTSCLISDHRVDEAHETKGTSEDLDIRCTGLRIPENCAKRETYRFAIGSHLLHKLVSLINVKTVENMSDENKTFVIRILETSLQVLLLLSSTPGIPGENLRNIIADDVFVLENLRDIFNYRGKSYLIFKTFALEILEKLTLNEKLKSNIGSTEGIVSSLLTLFLEEEHLRVGAGNLLNLLVFENLGNCHRLLDLSRFSHDTSNGSNIFDRLTKLFRLANGGNIWAAKIVRTICKCIKENDKDVLY